MEWLHGCDTPTHRLPAVWLVRTEIAPANLRERSVLRRETGLAILARQLGLPLAAIDIAHDPAGRPLIAAPNGTGLHLSLATRAGLVAVALAGAPIGVDVEQADPHSEPPLALLHPLEQRRLAGLHRAERALAFAGLWAAKEAYVKALGTGFAYAPESFAVTMEEDGFGFSVADPARPGAVHGGLRLIKNGGHGTMAAAAIVLR